jgi:hypothetical protein
VIRGAGVSTREGARAGQKGSAVEVGKERTARS